jgi:hypothetical protein
MGRLVLVGSGACLRVHGERFLRIVKGMVGCLMVTLYVFHGYSGLADEAFLGFFRLLEAV